MSDLSGIYPSCIIRGYLYIFNFSVCINNALDGQQTLSLSLSLSLYVNETYRVLHIAFISMTSWIHYVVPGVRMVTAGDIEYRCQ